MAAGDHSKRAFNRVNMLQIIEASTDDHIVLARTLFLEYEAAIGIELGFSEIPAYTFNPLPGVVYMQLDLSDAAAREDVP